MATAKRSRNRNTRKPWIERGESMKRRFVSQDAVLEGYEAVKDLYPHIPSLALWRAWECAVYREYRMPEPILDIGCGDGRFFQLLWPGAVDVVGVDDHEAVVTQAEQSGIYRVVHLARAQELPEALPSFASVFANCSLEHMDDLPAVLKQIHSKLMPDGILLASVVTDLFVDGSGLSGLLERIGEDARARAIQAGWERYHHLTNALAPEAWVEQLNSAGFEVVEHWPIVSEPMASLFLVFDQLWHLEDGENELGGRMQHCLESLPNFTKGFRKILAGLLDMQQDGDAIGAVMIARRPL